MAMRPHISLMLLNNLVKEVHGYNRNRSRFTELACIAFLEDERFRKAVLKARGEGARSQYTGARRGRYTLTMARPVVDALDAFLHDEDTQSVKEKKLPVGCSRSHLIEVIMETAVKDVKTRKRILHNILKVEDPRAPYTEAMPIAA